MDQKRLRGVAQGFAESRHLLDIQLGIGGKSQAAENDPMPAGDLRLTVIPGITRLLAAEIQHRLHPIPGDRLFQAIGAEPGRTVDDALLDFMEIAAAVDICVSSAKKQQARKGKPAGRSKSPDEEVAQGERHLGIVPSN